jgi:hypothetical protein
MASLVLVGRFGAGRRSSSQAFALSEPSLPIHLVANAEEVYELWHSEGTRGRKLVHLGKYLHFVAPERPYPTASLEEFPWDIVGPLEASLSQRDYLWVAMRANIVREITYVLPRETLQEKAEVAESSSTQAIVAEERGFRRTLVDRIPEIDEPVLLVVDASLWTSPDVQRLMNGLWTSPLRSDLAIFNLAEDNELVSEPAREGLRRSFAELESLRGPP